MKTVGIVAEFNPFHNGHKRLIDYARNILKADYIIIAMSGDFTQRGTIALMDKHSRAKMAIINGADLVLEIPTVFATSSAAEYANAGVRLLASTGIVDTLLFGAENPDICLFEKSAKTLIDIEKDPSVQEKIAELMKSGCNYAKIRTLFLDNVCPKDFASAPNNILGIEYVKVLIENNMNIVPVCMDRTGNDYHQANLSGNLSSATAIRNAIFDKKDFTASVPETTLEVINEYQNNNVLLNEDSVSELLHYKLLQENDFSHYWDVSPDISNKIANSKFQFTTMSDYTMVLKSKELSYTRVSRCLCHILLGIEENTVLKAKDLNYIQYIRMLGFSKSGSALLKLIKNNACAPMITSPNESDRLSTDAKMVLNIDCNAADIRRIISTSQTGISYPNEYTRKFDLCGL